MKPWLRLALSALPLLLSVPAPAQHNVLILIADDLGVDALGAYAEGASPPPTPNIDGLAASGVLFRNAWANPVCSPTRACLHTGRYSLRTLVGTAIPANNAGVLQLQEFTIPEVLDLGGSGYAHAAIGKWHLGDASNGGDLGPNLAGWSHFAGLLDGAVADYYNWQRTVDGVTAPATVYATTQIVDDAIAWIGQQNGPWLCYVAFNAPHTPFHAPPSGLHTQTLPGGNPNLDPVPFWRAAVEAMDTEIGRLLGSLGPARQNTDVIFLGDNGTARQVTELPFLSNHAKGTPYEGGVNVPLIVAGPDVAAAPREESALVAAVDVFASLAELSGVDAGAVVPAWMQLDSVSFVAYLASANAAAQRSSVFAEQFDGNTFATVNSSGSATIRNGQYKLIRFFLPAGGSRDEFYDLAADPWEQTNLGAGPGLSPAQRQQLNQLRAELNGLRSPAGGLFAFGDTGCVGSNGNPAIATSGSPALNQSYAVDLLGGAASSSAVLLAGSSNEAWGALALPFALSSVGAGPSCMLYTSGEIQVPVTTDAFGAASVTVSVPSDSALVGGLLFHSWLIVDPLAPSNPAGLTAADGLAVRIGT